MSGTQCGLASEWDQLRKARVSAETTRRWYEEDREGNSRYGQRRRMAASEAAMDDGQKPQKLAHGQRLLSKRQQWRSATTSYNTRLDGDGEEEEDIDCSFGLSARPQLQLSASGTGNFASGSNGGNPG